MSPSSSSYVAEVKGNIIGTIVVKPTCQESACEHFIRLGVATVHQFAVNPDIERKVIGLALLQPCETWTSQQGYRELAMDTAEQANT